MLTFGSATRNIEPILSVLKQEIPIDKKGYALEVASGSGQHIIRFADTFKDITWTPSDINPEHLESIQAYIDSNDLSNLNSPKSIDCSTDFKEWGFDDESLDVIMSTNLIHISPIEVCQGLINASGSLLKKGGFLIFYGPFAKDGQLYPQSNVDFDASLKSRDSRWGIRDINYVSSLAEKVNLSLYQHHDMPANNNMYFFQKQ